MPHTSPHQRGEQLVVIHIGDVEIILCSIVWWTEFDRLQQGTAGIGRLDEEMVIANQTENLAVAIDAVVAEHLLDRYLTRAAALVGNILDEI